MLVESGHAADRPALRSLATGGPNPLGRLHALWTLSGPEQLDEATVATALRDQDDRVGSAAVRLTEPFLRKEKNCGAILSRLEPLVTDPSAELRIQLALLFGEARDPRAERMMTTLVRDAGADLLMAYAVGTGLAHRELEFLEKLVADSPEGTLASGTAAWSANSPPAWRYERQASRVERFLRLAGTASGAWKTNLLTGFAQAAPFVARRPIILTEASAILAELKNSADTSVAAAAAKTDALLT